MLKSLLQMPGVYLLRWLDITPDGRSYAYNYQQDLCDLYVLDGLI